MHAITVRPQWAWAMLNAGNRVENRDFWPEALEGRTIALHAGRGLTGPTSQARALRDLTFALAKAGHVAAPVWFKGQPPAAFWFPTPLARDFDAAAFELARAGHEWKFRRFVGEQINPEAMPNGCIFAVAELHRVVTSDAQQVATWGVEGRIKWMLRHFEPLEEPVPYGRGQLGVWTVPPLLRDEIIRGRLAYRRKELSHG